MVSPLLKCLSQKVKEHQKRQRCQWIQEQPSPSDLEWLKSQVDAEGQFDTLGCKRDVWQGVLDNTFFIDCRTCRYGKVIALLPNGYTSVPWKTWALIFELFSGTLQSPIRLLWFASPLKRLLPPVGQQVGPEHVNGGYTIPCAPDTIVVYREEEATRVLIHELYHASCTDRDLPIEYKEAETESWAELALVAIASKGNLKKAEDFWKKQATWIANSNKKLQLLYGVTDPSQYAWRYTVGREQALNRLGFTLPEGRVNSRTMSSRLTLPIFDGELV